MTNFIMGILAGFAIFGAIIILVDQLRHRGFNINFNPIDILGGVLASIRDKMTEYATAVAERRANEEFADEEAHYAKHSMWNSERLDILDAIYEVDEELADEVDADMEYINSMVDFCEGKV